MTVGGPTSWGSNEQRGINLATWTFVWTHARSVASPLPPLSLSLSLGVHYVTFRYPCLLTKRGGTEVARIPKARVSMSNARDRGGPNYGFSAGTVKPSGHVELVK